MLVHTQHSLHPWVQARVAELQRQLTAEREQREQALDQVEWYKDKLATECEERAAEREELNWYKGYYEWYASQGEENATGEPQEPTALPRTCSLPTDT